jgi:hypothetical protein
MNTTEDDLKISKMEYLIFLQFSVGAAFYLTRLVPSHFRPKCCRHSFSDFGHGQKKQMTLKRVHNTRRFELRFTGDTSKFGSVAREKHYQVREKLCKSLPDLHSGKKLPAITGVWRAAQCATAGHGSSGCPDGEHADQARYLGRDNACQAFHTRAAKHSADPAPDVEEALRRPSEAHAEDSVFGGMQPGAQDALNCQEVALQRRYLPPF